MCRQRQLASWLAAASIWATASHTHDNERKDCATPQMLHLAREGPAKIP
jgi:hypothetical protein